HRDEIGQRREHLHELGRLLQDLLPLLTWVRSAAVASSSVTSARARRKSMLLKALSADPSSGADRPSTSCRAARRTSRRVVGSRKPTSSASEWSGASGRPLFSRSSTSLHTTQLQYTHYASGINHVSVHHRSPHLAT